IRTYSMRNALKFTLGSLLAAAVAAPAVAGTHPLMDNLAVRVAGTYTEASNNGASFGFLPVVGNTIFRPVFVEPKHTWDYALGLEYRISGHNTRVVFSYDHFD